MSETTDPTAGERVPERLFVMTPAALDAVRRKAGNERTEQAWDEGHLDGCEDSGRMTARLHRELCLKRNPYRAARIARGGA